MPFTTRYYIASEADTLLNLSPHTLLQGENSLLQTKTQKDLGQSYPLV